MGQKNPFQPTGMDRSRRSWLGSLAGAGTLGIAGCLGGTDSSNSPDEEPTDEESTDEPADETTDQSESYPADVVRIIVPYGSGGLMDRNYRGFQPYFEETIGVSTTVDNRPGAGGRTGTTEAYRMDPDGYSLIANDPGGIALGATLFNVGYSIDDITTIVEVQRQYHCLVAQESRWSSLEEFLAYAEDADRITFGVAHKGSTSHLRGIVIADGIGLDLEKVTFVPSGGTPDMIADAARGDIDVGMPGASTSAASAFDEQGLTPLFVHREDEDPLFPDAPNVQDYPQPLVPFAMCLFAPPDVPTDRVETVREAARTAIENDEYQSWAEEQSIYPVGGGPEQVAETMDTIVSASQEYEDILTG